MSTLLQAAGLPLVDLDVLAREAVAPHSYALSALAKHFGPTIVLPDGSLDRAALGAIVFVDDKQRRVLNSITHPAVRRLLAWALVKAWLRGDKVCVVDAPLLIEAGLWKFCGAIIVVYWSVPSAPSPLPSPARVRTLIPNGNQLRGTSTPAALLAQRLHLRRGLSAHTIAGSARVQARLRRLRHR